MPELTDDFPYYQTELHVDCDYIDEHGNKCEYDWPSLDELDY
tara:strand:+ start:896 stop:1021 length:126 start_codon:yes stop_codon:yes gene_type:complete